MNLPDPKQIINGEINYSLEDFFNELKDDWFNVDFQQELTDAQRKDAFNSLFMLILLSGEDKPMSVLLKVYKFEENKIKEMQEAYKEEINVVRYLHMKKYLDLYSNYQGGMDMTLRLLNVWVQDFLKKHIKEETDGNT